MSKYNSYLQPFTKEWWDNFWYYYKWYVVLGIVLLGSLVIFITDLFGDPKSDFTMMYAGDIHGMGSVEGYALEDRFKPITSDVDGDGEHFVKSTVIYIDEKEKNSTESAMGVILDAELQSGETTVFFASEYLLGRFPQHEMQDLSPYVEKFNIPEHLVKRTEDGSVYAISLSENPIFTEMEGVDATNIYMLVRPIREGADNSEYKKQLHANGLEMAQHILSGGTYIPEQVDYKSLR